jgi:hypothetical protein
LMGPLQMRGLIMFLPQFVRVFYRLMPDERVSVLARAVPLLGVLALISPPLLELDFIPIIGEVDWILAITRFSLSPRNDATTGIGSH